MTTKPAMRIRDCVEVRKHPTVVRLDDLDSPGHEWLKETFSITAEVESHLSALAHLLGGRTGGGAFLIGQYGAGKSHFLSYVALQLRAGDLVRDPPDVVALSLVNYGAGNRLEDIVSVALGIECSGGDRRPVWDGMLARHNTGLFLLIDELSEFLRAKPQSQAFTEDVRFLQFMGEWAQSRPFWILAAMQEGIEHTGEIEYALYRKIKDRYRLRLLLTPAHVRSLISDAILVKKPEYESAVEALCGALREAHASSGVDLEALRSIYPVHPATLELLEEVRDRFSQARGIVDFTVARLAGDPARGVEPFLDQPFGALLTPDAIVDHFRDLLEVQPEFLPLSQELFPWYRRHLDELFELPAQRALVEKLLNLLVLVHLSPSRQDLSADEATSWLLVTASRIEPERNREIVARLLERLAREGRYVAVRDGRYQLRLRDDGSAALERLLAQETSELKGRDWLVLETVVPLLPATGFNPFTLPRDQWQHRRLLWHFHERRYAIWLGNGEPAGMEGIGVCLRLPWDQAAPIPGLHTIEPETIPVTADLVELAALVRLKQRSVPAEVTERIEHRLRARSHLVHQAIRSAWQNAKLVTPDGKREPAPRLEAQSTLESWLETIALWALRRSYPAFERFAPGHGPLPKESWVRLMRFAASEDLGSAEADDYVKLIREAYLVPMGLLRRKGREYVAPGNLDQHELVRLLTPLLEHSPTPQAVRAHLAEPIYGLVPDQINLLLVFLLLQGEIDILKGRKSYRESFEMLPNPLHYDRIVRGHALSVEQLAGLERLCEGLGMRRPAHWSVLTQRRVASQLAEVRRHHVQRLQPLQVQLAGLEQGEPLARRIHDHLKRWNALDKGEHELQGLQQFLFEIGSPAAFVEEVKAFAELSERGQHLLAETRRYLHLLADPAVQQALGGDAAAPLPSLDDPGTLDEWLARTGEAYLRYKQSYAQRHERWWNEVSAHPIWEWRIPSLARSRHVELGETVREIQSCRGEVEQRRCRGLVNLDYQPRCSCGFDGESAPIAPLLAQLERLRDTVETRLRVFFQQDTVKAQVLRWQRDGLEVNEGTLSYLEGRRPIPEVADLSAFDAYLTGADLAVDIDIGAVVETLRQRLWDRSELLDTLSRQFGSQEGRRLRFTGTAGQAVSEQVLQWCAEQSLRSGVRLPAGLSRKELETVADAVRPEWVRSRTLAKLEDLGLTEAGVDRVLTWVADGTVALSGERWPAASLTGLVADLRAGRVARTPTELAEMSGRLYRAHPRLHRVAGQRWLSYLDAVACSTLEDALPRLVDALQAGTSCQWVLLDGAGLPILAAIEPVLSRGLDEWRRADLSFAQATGTTTTDACYSDLLSANLVHGFEKINAIDELLHEGFAPFAELVTVAAAKVKSAIERLLPRLSPERPILLFADHGFRLEADGRRYVHGGPSTLERVVPLWRFVPRRPSGVSV